MLGLSELDGDAQGRHRKHAAPLHSRSRRGRGRLTVQQAAEGCGRPRILALDTAGSACSVALAAAERVLSCHGRTMERGQAEALLPMVDAVMREAALCVAALDLIAVTVGPGSFTGIRVGLAAAKGIALAAAVPLLGVTAFEAVAVSIDTDGDNPLLLVALESRRAELYVQAFGRGHPLTGPAAVPPEALAAWAEAVCGRRRIAIAGDGAVRAVSALDARPGVMVVSPRGPVAVGVAREALRRWRRGERHGRTEPLYLRPPDVTRPGGTAGRPA